MFMSRDQTTGQNHYIKVANKSYGKVHVFGNGVNKSELHSRINQEQTEFD
jgi:hypothetical protein